MKFKFILITILLTTMSLSCFSLTEIDKEISAKEMLGNFKVFFETEDTFQLTSFTMNKSYIYIVDFRHCQIYIYSKVDKKRVKIFGQQGRGPGDLDGISHIDCTDDYLYVTSYDKFSIFDSLGNFIDEFKLKKFYFSIAPFKNKLIGTEQKMLNIIDRRYVFSLFDLKMDKEKQIFQLDIKRPKTKDKNKQVYILFPECRKAAVYKEKIFIACTDEGFKFHVFDMEGKKLYDISKNEKPELITDDIKNLIYNTHKKSMGEDYKTFIRNREFYFPEYYPAFINFFITNDKIFIFKYPDSKLENFSRKNEVLIMDLKGNILSRKLIGMESLYTNLKKFDFFSPTNYCFYDGILYLSLQKEESTLIISLDIETLLNLS